MIRENFVLERRPLWDELANLLLSIGDLQWDELVAADQEDLRCLAREVHADWRYLRRHFHDDPLVGYLRELGAHAEGIGGMRARFRGFLRRHLVQAVRWAGTWAGVSDLAGTRADAPHSPDWVPRDTWRNAAAPFTR